jgi:hypothetical protein
MNDICYGVGSGFGAGSINLKDYADSRWYSIQVSGSVGSASIYTSSPLTYFGTSSYYDINFPYQLLGAPNGNVYQLYLSASILVISQSIYSTTASITDVYGAVHDLCKPSLLFQNISTGDYHNASLATSASVIVLQINQTAISASWIHQ